MRQRTACALGSKEVLEPDSGSTFTVILDIDEIFSTDELALVRRGQAKAPLIPQFC